MQKSLNGIWKLQGRLISSHNIDELKVNVPGSIYYDLLKNKLMPDPFYRSNESLMLDYVKDDFAYIKDFILRKTDLNKEINLVFLGLDSVTEIYLNGKLIYKTYNMHRRYTININKYAFVGTNTLKVVIKSPLKFIEEESKKNTHELMNMHYAVKGYASLRKAHCMFGWDWGPQMPDGGIFRPVYLEILDKGKIDDVLVYQDTTSNLSKIKLVIKNHLLKSNLKLKVSLKNSNYLFEKELMAENENEVEFDVVNPHLWYPVGYGEQNLYELEVTLFDSTIIDTKKQKIGLRKIEIKREKDEYGESFMPIVNGQMVFLKGSDYIIEDNLITRRDINHTKFLLNSMLDANQNCIRIWGGALYPSDEFYNICDEAGILVWQDLMFACGYYNLENEAFVEEIKKEIIDNVTRIHNHPSLMLICGNNENETAALDWNIPSPEYTKKWYLYQYEELIPNLLQKVAYDIFYWPSSPSSGGGFDEPNSDKRGDMHYWGVWHNNEPIENYKKYFPRVLSEFGMQSFPSMKTINSFTLPSDRNIYSFVMERHQKNLSANQKIMNYIGSMFKYPKDLENIAYVSQLIQAEAVRCCVEHLRRNYPRCMGAIYWQLNDCWPVASWSSIDYYDRYKALQYFSKKFFSPILVSIDLKNDTKLDYEVKVSRQSFDVVLTNETKNSLQGTYEVSVVDYDGNVIDITYGAYKMDKYCAKKLITINTDLSLDEQMKSVIRVKVYNDGKLIAENHNQYLRDKYLDLAKPEIKADLKRIDDTYYLSLVSDTYTKYVSLDLKKDDVIFSDNFFNLYKDEEKVVTFKINKNIKLKDIVIKNLLDSY